MFNWKLWLNTLKKEHLFWNTNFCIADSMHLEDLIARQHCLDRKTRFIDIFPLTESLKPWDSLLRV